MSSGHHNRFCLLELYEQVTRDAHILRPALDVFGCKMTPSPLLEMRIEFPCGRGQSSLDAAIWTGILNAPQSLVTQCRLKQY